MQVHPVPLKLEVHVGTVDIIRCIPEVEVNPGALEAAKELGELPSHRIIRPARVFPSSARGQCTLQAGYFTSTALKYCSPVQSTALKN
jgi:hypothetical protein